MTHLCMDQILHVRITDQLAKRLDSVCRRTLIARSAFVRRALENALDPKTGIESQIVLAADKAEAERSNAEDIANGGGK
jgi:metal-responsive CopG/Arc/MetJ family transcriptional regulator